ncbi:MAG: pyridoxal 5'-phosphate synthase glutaminase subunit PdxT [Terriglobales bacterium]
MRRVGVLALQGDFAAHGEALRREGCEPVWVRRASDLDGLCGIVLPGGESTTMLKFLAQENFAGRLRAFVDARPTLATCAGTILLAKRVRAPEQASLGVLDVTAVRNAYGRHRESSIRTAAVTPEFQSELGVSAMETVLIRAPQLEDLGPEVAVVAREREQPVLVRQRNLLAATFHPELSATSPVHRWFAHLLQSA